MQSRVFLKYVQTKIEKYPLIIIFEDEIYHASVFYTHPSIFNLLKIGSKKRGRLTKTQIRKFGFGISELVVGSGEQDLVHFKNMFKN